MESHQTEWSGASQALMWALTGGSPGTIMRSRLYGYRHNAVLWMARCRPKGQTQIRDGEQCVNPTIKTGQSDR